MIRLRRTALLASSLFLFLSQNGLAQGLDTASPTDITTVVVRNEIPGPFMWKVTMRKGTAWVLGFPKFLPIDFSWDDTRLRRHLKQADLVITPPKPDRYVVEPLEFLPDGITLADVVPDKEYTVFVEAIEARKYPRSDFTNLTPYSALSKFWRRSYREAGLEYAPFGNRFLLNVLTESGKRNKPAGVWNRHLHSAGLKKLLYEHPDCLIEAVKEIEHNETYATPIAQAWAYGDYATFLKLHKQSTWINCLYKLKDNATFSKTFIADFYENAILTEFEKGHTIVVLMPFEDLLSENGVLRRLEERGAVVEIPGKPARIDDMPTK